MYLVELSPSKAASNHPDERDEANDEKERKPEHREDAEHDRIGPVGNLSLRPACPLPLQHLCYAAGTCQKVGTRNDGDEEFGRIHRCKAKGFMALAKYVKSRTFFVTSSYTCL